MFVKVFFLPVELPIESKSKSQIFTNKDELDAACRTAMPSNNDMIANTGFRLAVTTDAGHIARII